MTVDPGVRARLARLIRDVPDWPSPGVVFKDITPLLADAAAFELTVEALAAPGRDAAGRTRVEAVVGIEARGFILAAPVAHLLGAGFVPVRKHGKLPHETHAAAYALEYGEAVLELHRDALRPGARVLIVDDVLATGGTVNAAAGLVSRAGATVTAVSLLIELGFLGGRTRLSHLDVRSVLQL